jgi:hypothetical protein
MSRVALTFAILIWLCSPADASTERVIIQGPVPADVQEIEIIYPDGKSPTVILKTISESPVAVPVRPSTVTVDLLKMVTKVKAFGECDAWSERKLGAIVLDTTSPVKNLCGHVLMLRQADAPQDFLSYDTLHLRGETTEPLLISLIDEASERRESAVPVIRVNGRFDLRVSLRLSARRLDLRRVVAASVIPETRRAHVILESLTVEHVGTGRQTDTKRGYWVWKYREALKDPDAVLDACLRLGCQRMLIQVPDLDDPETLWKAYAGFLHTAHGHHIEVFALDGYPEAVEAPEPLIVKIQKLLRIVDRQSLDGVQLDLEPYLLEGWAMDEGAYSRYLDTVDAIKAVLSGTRFSIVMPFWFTSQVVRDRPVAFSVMDRVDEVAVMTYRTDVAELQAIAEDNLRYGDLAGVPIWLAIETRPLPIERHVLLKRTPRRDLGDAYLDRPNRQVIFRTPPAESDGSDWFRVHHRVTVSPERLSFAGQSQTAVLEFWDEALKAMPHASLAGVLIHDLEGFQALAEGQP